MFERLPDWVSVAGEWLVAIFLGMSAIAVTLLVGGIIASRHLMRHRKSKPYSNTGEMYISKAKKGGYRVTIDGKHIGIFKTLDSAVMARDNALGGFGK